MHTWEEQGVDWKGINDAAEWIGSFLVRWGRVSVSDTKEKWGTARVYCRFGWTQLHDLTHPRYAYLQYPKWLIRLDFAVFMPIISRSIGRWIVPYHKFLYRLAYKKAIKKWPHLKLEILNGADYPELLDSLK